MAPPPCPAAHRHMERRQAFLPLQHQVGPSCPFRQRACATHMLFPDSNVNFIALTHSRTSTRLGSGIGTNACGASAWPGSTRWRGELGCAPSICCCIVGRSLPCRDLAARNLLLPTRLARSRKRVTRSCRMPRPKPRLATGSGRREAGQAAVTRPPSAGAGAEAGWRVERMELSSCAGWNASRCTVNGPVIR